MKKNITILGTGAYGTVLANVLADNKNNVTMFGIDEKQVLDIQNNNLNSRFFGSTFINKNIKATTNPKIAFKNVNILIIAVPTVAINSILELIDNNLKTEVHLINTTKGLDADNLDLLSSKIKKYFKNNKLILSYAGLYGPSLAKECIEKKPTCIMIADENINSAKELCEIFNNNYFHTFPTNDVVGCEIAAALKNTVAIACGIIDGLNYGYNAHASLLTIGNNEIYLFAKHFGANLETFLNFATFGDLVLTAGSKDSRNFTLGNKIAFKKSAKNVLKTYNVTVEGVTTCKIAFEMAKKYNLKLPLFELMYEILYNNLKPNILLGKLLNN